MKKEDRGAEKDYLIALDELFEEWIRTRVFHATESYKNWQHDKGSFAYGYIMGLKAAQQKLRERRDLLT